MAKPKWRKPDHALAEDLELLLSPFTITLKHAHQLRAVGRGFYFAFYRDQVLYYDSMPVWRYSLGIRQKPERFILHPSVHQRLMTNHYQYWYYHDHKYLYPLQKSKVSVFLESFIIVPDDNPFYRTEVVFSIETPQIRRKPLQRSRVEHLWQVEAELDACETT